PSLSDVIAVATREREAQDARVEAAAQRAANAIAEHEAAKADRDRAVAIETFLIEQAGDSSSESLPGRNGHQIEIFADRFAGKSKWELAQLIWSDLKHPMRAGDMGRIIREAGYSQDMDPQVLANAITTAMMRKSDGPDAVFRKFRRGLWGLAGWKDE